MRERHKAEVDPSLAGGAGSLACPLWNKLKPGGDIVPTAYKISPLGTTSPITSLVVQHVKDILTYVV